MFSTPPPFCVYHPDYQVLQMHETLGGPCPPIGSPVCPPQWAPCVCAQWVRQGDKHIKRRLDVLNAGGCFYASHPPLRPLETTSSGSHLSPDHSDQDSAPEEGAQGAGNCYANRQICCVALIILRSMPSTPGPLKATTTQSALGLSPPRSPPPPPL